MFKLNKTQRVILFISGSFILLFQSYNMIYEDIEGIGWSIPVFLGVLLIIPAITDILVSRLHVYISNNRKRIITISSVASVIIVVILVVIHINNSIEQERLSAKRYNYYLNELMEKKKQEDEALRKLSQKTGIPVEELRKYTSD